MAISDLPVNVLIHILVKLPLESLGQFKCVSKSWNSLISSNKFMDSHIHQSRSRFSQKPSVLLVEQRNEIHMVEFSFTGDVMDERQPFMDCKWKRIHCLPELHDDRIIIQIVGSVNGLICLILSPKHSEICSYHTHENCCLVDDYAFSLCNPLTKSIWELPGNQWKRLFSEDESMLGFSYDDVNDDYKVVILNLVLENVGINVYECEVYSLKSNSWSKIRTYIDFSFEYKVSRYKAWDKVFRVGVLANCALHWIFSDDQSKQVFILAFDLRTYKPNMLPMPDGVEVDDPLELTVLNSSLVLSRCLRDSFDLWIMKDYGLNDSWMRITFDKSFESFTPLALLEDNHKSILISFDDFDCLLELFDLVTHQRRSYPAIDLQGAKQFQFVGSLVQPYPPFVEYENASSEEDRVEHKLGSLIKEQILDAPKNFDKFHIHVNGVSLDSRLPEHVRRKYYDLCCNTKSFLHERLVPDIPSKLAVSMIIAVVNIADSIRSCRFTTSKEEIEKWDKALRSFELLCMNVGFLRDRLCRLLYLAFDSEEGIEAKKYWEMKTERSQTEDEIEDLEKRLVEMKEACKKYDDEVNALKTEAEICELMFQEEANAPW